MTRKADGLHLIWPRPPILVTSDVTGSGFVYEPLVGFTRLGNLLGLLDRWDVPEMKSHRVWVGKGITQRVSSRS